MAIKVDSPVVFGPARLNLAHCVVNLVFQVGVFAVGKHLLKRLPRPTFAPAALNQINVGVKLLVIQRAVAQYFCIMVARFRGLAKLVIQLPGNQVKPGCCFAFFKSREGSIQNSCCQCRFALALMQVGFGEVKIAGVVSVEWLNAQKLRHIKTIIIVTCFRVGSHQTH